jgi:hypothetical protein
MSAKVVESAMSSHIWDADNPTVGLIAVAGLLI